MKIENYDKFVAGLLSGTYTDKRDREARGYRLTRYKDNLLHGALGITGEAGELAGDIKKYLFYGYEPDWDNMVLELGDIMFYIQNIINCINELNPDNPKITIETVIDRNKMKLIARYPKGTWSEKDCLERKDEK